MNLKSRATAIVARRAGALQHRFSSACKHNRESRARAVDHAAGLKDGPLICRRRNTPAQARIDQCRLGLPARLLQDMRIPILRAEPYRDEDAEGKPVVLVDENLAKRFWPNETGRQHWLRQSDSEIIGVVKEVKAYGSEAKPLIKIYTPLGRGNPQSAVLSVRTSTADPQALTSSITREVQALDKDLPVTEVATLDEILAHEVAPKRFNTGLLAIFAALALLLAATGVYGVTAYTVAQRTQEVGIRMALGARPGDVLRLFLSEGMRLVLAGVALGIGCAFALTRLLSSLLFGVSATDRTTFVIVAMGLPLVALLACYLPARRATRVDPLVALRYE